jgi:predicted glycosyltransferase
MGIGHVRRNLLIAQKLAAGSLQATSLLICGVHEASTFVGGNGVDCLTLPSLTKVGADDYQPRDLRLSQSTLTDIRKATLLGSLTAFAPDILIVDKVPKGVHDELVDLLPILRASGTKTVFGMREILDDAAAVSREWLQRDYQSFIRDNYDSVWIYGDPQIFDAIEAYGLNDLGTSVHFTGYLDQRERLQFSQNLNDDRRFAELENVVLCMVGGGQDGEDLARAFAAAKLPDGLNGMLVTGPLMDAACQHEIRAVAQGRRDLQVVDSVREADWLVKKAYRVICMGGYNSMLSVVSFGKPSLIVPRVAPRKEQFIRAERFHQHGFVDWLSPDRLDADAITHWLANHENHRVPDRTRICLNGLSKVQHLCTTLLRQQQQEQPIREVAL